MGLMAFHSLVLIVTLISRRHFNFHMFLFLLACKLSFRRFCFYPSVLFLLSNDLTGLVYSFHIVSSDWGAIFDTSVMQIYISLPLRLAYTRFHVCLSTKIHMDKWILKGKYDIHRTTQTFIV